MILNIVQDDTDAVDYHSEAVAYLKSKARTQEQLESRFDAVMTEFALMKVGQGYDAVYEAKTKTLTIMS